MRVIRFTASWCAPCKALANLLNEVNTNVPIDVYDIDEHQEFAVEYGIRSVPTLIMLDGNIEVKRQVGLMQKKDLAEWLTTN